MRNCGVKQSASGWPPSNSLCAQTQPNQDRPGVDRGQSHPTTASGTRPCLRRASGQPLHTHCTCLDAPATGAFPTPTTAASRFLIEKVSRQRFSSARPTPLTGPRPVMSESYFRRLGRRLFIRRRFSGTPARRFGRRRFVIGICDRSRGTADLYPAFGALARIADPVSLCLPIFVGRNNGLHILTRQLPVPPKGPPPSPP